MGIVTGKIAGCPAIKTALTDDDGNYIYIIKPNRYVIIMAEVNISLGFTETGENSEVYKVMCVVLEKILVDKDSSGMYIYNELYNTYILNKECIDSAYNNINKAI